MLKGSSSIRLLIWLTEPLPSVLYMKNKCPSPHSPFHLQAMSYLTYIIDHYESLPDIVLFMHGHRASWHMQVGFRLAFLLQSGKIPAL